MTEVGLKAIGRYEIRRELGRGAMGVVYEAQDTLLRRTVALKTIHLALSSSPDVVPETFKQRFVAEAQAAAALAHPGIVVVYDVGVERSTGRLYMALEYLVGRTLDALAAGQPMEWRRALYILRRVAEALAHAHAQGIVHRDIKPGNIMVLESGEPKIMDFGIAKLPMGALTTGGQVLGSPSYMSPERAAGEKVDGRSDIFALGAILYELLAGRRAFPGKDLPEILMKVAYENPTPPSQVVGGLPPEVDYVVTRALAKALSDRYPDAQQMAEDLGDLLDGRPPRHSSGWAAPERPRETLASKSSKVAPPAPPAPPAVDPVGEGTIRGGEGPSLALPANKRVSLAILAGAGESEVFVLEKARVLIGRAGGRVNADIEIQDPEASKAHAMVECHGNRIVVRDMGSTNGTYVGAERITECELENHAEFRVGRTQFIVIVADRE